MRWSDALIADAAGIADYYRHEFGAPTTLLTYGAPLIEPGSDRLAELGLEPGGVPPRRRPLRAGEPRRRSSSTGYARSAATKPLVVVGSAPYSDEYTARVHAAADDRVRFLGGVWDQEQLDQLYAQLLHLPARALGRRHQPVAAARHRRRRGRAGLRRATSTARSPPRPGATSAARPTWPRSSTPPRPSPAGSGPPDGGPASWPPATTGTTSPPATRSWPSPLAASRLPEPAPDRPRGCTRPRRRPVRIPAARAATPAIEVTDVLGHPVPAERSSDRRRPGAAGPTRRCGRPSQRLAGAQKGAVGAPAYSRFVNRKLGRLLAAVAFHAGLTPNAVTGDQRRLHRAPASRCSRSWPAVVGRWALAVAALPGPRATRFDAADGQLARLRGGGSPAGEWLDHMVDAVKASEPAPGACSSASTASRPSSRSWLLLVPLGYCLVDAVTYFAHDAQRGAPGAARRRDPGPADGAAGRRGRARCSSLPTDYGLLACVFVLFGAPVAVRPRVHGPVPRGGGLPRPRLGQVVPRDDEAAPMTLFSRLTADGSRRRLVVLATALVLAAVVAVVAVLALRAGRRRRDVGSRRPGRSGRRRVDHRRTSGAGTCAGDAGAGRADGGRHRAAPEPHAGRLRRARRRRRRHHRRGRVPRGDRRDRVREPATSPVRRCG